MSLASDLLFYTAAAATPDLAVDVGSLERVPVMYGPMPQLTDPDTDEPLVDPPITVHVYDRNWDDIELFELDESHHRGWLDQLNEVGSASVALDNDDVDLALLDLTDHMLQFRLYGWKAFTMLPRQLVKQSVSQDEELGEQSVITGPGHLALLDEALVYPSRGLDQFPVEEDRVFNWASPYLDDTGWGNAVAVVQQGTPSLYWSGMPNGWPAVASGAWWLFRGGSQEWAQQGFCYFRKTFTVPSGTTRMRIFCGADAQGEVWLDGQLILATTYTASDPTELFEVTVDITAGTHLIAACCLNDPDPESDETHNPGGIVISAVACDAFGTLGSVVVETDDTWLMVDNTVPNGYSGPEPVPPGITPGRVIRAVFEEAQDRGELLGVNLACSDFGDVEGHPWPVVGEVATKVGTDVLTFLREMSGTYIDFAMPPAGLDVWVWAIDERGATRSVTLHEPTDVNDPNTGNLTELVHTIRPPKANVVLIRWSGGWHEVLDQTSVDLHGRRVVVLGLGAVQSVSEAERIGRKQLEIYADSRTEISAGHEPIDVGPVVDPFTATDLPYWFFRVGDIITVPDENGDATSERVMQLTVSEDEEGLPTFTPVLKDVLLQSQERWEQALKKMTDGTVRGDSKVATPIGSIRTWSGANTPNCCNDSTITAVADEYTWTGYASTVDVVYDGASPANVLSNDAGSGLSVSSTGTITADSGIGTVDLNADGTLSYTPGGPGTYDGVFTYTITDGTASSSSTITIHANVEG